MPNLRKRKAATSSDPSAAKRIKSSTKPVSQGRASEKSRSAHIATGDNINLEDFGGQVWTTEGTLTDLKSIISASRAGVIIFTYPKASTPGCMLKSHQGCHEVF